MWPFQVDGGADHDIVGCAGGLRFRARAARAVWVLLTPENSGHRAGTINAYNEIAAWLYLRTLQREPGRWRYASSIGRKCNVGCSWLPHS